MPTRFRAPLLALLAACGNAPEPSVPAPPPLVPATTAVQAAPPPVVVWQPTPDAPFRLAEPGAVGESTFTPPKFERFKSHGVDVILSEQHELPVVSLRMVIHAGAGESMKPWKYAALGQMLEQGTETRSALQISDEFEALGADHSTWFGWDSGELYTRALSSNAEGALKLLADCWLHPTFPQEELERLRTRRLTSLSQEKTNPGAMAQNAAAVAVFGRSHPYGNPLSGAERDVKSMTRKDIVDLHAQLKRSVPMTLVAVGDLDRAKVEAWLTSAFGDVLAKRTLQNPAAVAAPPAGPSSPAPPIYLVNMPKATQSTVLLVTAGSRMNTADRYALTVMNAVFGGTFASRVNMNLREKHAYTYGARSRFSMRRGVGPFSVGGAMVADHTGDALRELLAEAKRMTEAEPTADELALAKNGLRLSLPGRFQTASDVTSGLSDLPVYGLADNEFETWPTKVSAVTGADALRVAKTYLAKFRIVIVGDRDKVLPQIESLKLGKVLELDAFGDPLKPEKK